MPKAVTDRILDTMIELARCSREHRVILIGHRDSERIFDWRRRGYHRAVTTATSRLPRGQYDVACIEWRHHSIKALEATLDWFVHFLSPAGVLVLWIDEAIDTAPGRRHLRAAVDRFGFRVEAETRCGNGLAISARRSPVAAIAHKAAATPMAAGIRLEPNITAMAMPMTSARRTPGLRASARLARERN